MDFESGSEWFSLHDEFSHDGGLRDLVLEAGLTDVVLRELDPPDLSRRILDALEGLAPTA